MLRFCMLFLLLLLLLQIVPADLNAFLYQMESNIAWAADLLGETDTAQRFEAAARERRNSINLLLWDNEAGGSGRGGAFGVLGLRVEERGLNTQEVTNLSACEIEGGGGGCSGTWQAPPLGGPWWGKGFTGLGSSEHVQSAPTCCCGAPEQRWGVSLADRAFCKQRM